MPDTVPSDTTSAIAHRVERTAHRPDQIRPRQVAAWRRPFEQPLGPGREVTPRQARAVYDRLLAAYGPQHWWPGDTPFEIMVGAVLTQNTAWLNVERAIDNLKAADLLVPERILATADATLADLLRPSGYFNVKAVRLKNLCRWLVEAGGLEAVRDWPTEKLRHSLLAVKGVGPETADDILLYAFARPVFVVDAYTRRLFSRLGLCAPDAGYESLRHAFERVLPPDVAMFNEYHALIVAHAKDICRPRPRCGECSLRRRCPAAKTLAD